MTATTIQESIMQGDTFAARGRRWVAVGRDVRDGAPVIVAAPVRKDGSLGDARENRGIRVEEVTR